jgi:hypothetical protein
MTCMGEFGCLLAQNVSRALTAGPLHLRATLVVVRNEWTRTRTLKSREVKNIAR